MYMLQFQGRTPSRSLLILTCDSRSFYPNRLPPVYGHVWGKWVQTKDVFTIACVYMHIHAHRSKTFDLRVRVGVISWSKTCHTSGTCRHDARDVLIVLCYQQYIYTLVGFYEHNAQSSRCFPKREATKQDAFPRSTKGLCRSDEYGCDGMNWSTWRTHCRLRRSNNFHLASTT
jgi:hypothetical protein